MPIDYIKQVRDPKNDWGKINKKRLVELEKYKDKWRAIKDLLQNVNKVNS